MKYAPIIGLVYLLLLYPPPTFSQTLQASALVDRVYQTPNEEFDRFIDRAARRMSKHTASSGFEACGHICRRTDLDLHAIMIFTGGSQIGCPILAACPLGNYGLPGEFMHSHPHKRRVVLNEEDVKTLEGTKRARKKVGSTLWVSPNRFSSRDYDIGPGYMIYKDQLWHQRGRATAKRVRVVEPVRIDTTKPHTSDP